MSWMAQLSERGRQRHGDRLAVVDGGRRVTYAELDRRTDGLAAAFQAMGIAPGHRVAVLSHNRLEVLETYFGLGKIGAVAVPIHYGAAPDEAAAMMRGCEAAAVVGAAELLKRLPESAARVTLAFESDEYRAALTRAPHGPPDDVPDDGLLFILHTSATTGRPKGVCIDHGSLRSVTLGYLAEVRPDRDVVFLHCGPLSHGAMVLPLVYMAAGATVVLMRMFSPAECLATIRRTKATHLFVVPEMLRFMLQNSGFSRDRLVSLREVIYAAAPMPRPLLVEAHAGFGCGFRQVYGVTEGGGPVATLAPSEHDYTPGEVRGPAASVGRAIMGARVRSRPDAGQAPPSGRVGELLLRGPGLMRGYLNDPAATGETMPDGWLRTGDLGTVDAEGYVHLTGRAKDVIIRGGQKVFPAEVENVLLAHPAVREACVVGVPSEEWGELPFAYVASPESGAELLGALRRLTRERLAVYKRPVGFEVVPDLPRSAVGKIARGDLRARAAGAALRPGGRLADPRAR